MDVNRRTASPDFAAGEAQFFRKLRTAFAELQTQCENEKLSNQRSFEHEQQAIQKHIRDLEARCSDLEKKRREAEDAHNKAALELQQRKDEETQGLSAHRESEEKRRRKYSALLAGSSTANLRLVITPHQCQNTRPSLAVETGQLTDSGSNSQPSRIGREGTRSVHNLSHGQGSMSITLDTGMSEEVEHRSMEAEGDAACSPAHNSTEILEPGADSPAVSRESNVAQALVTTEIRQGKRKRVPTTKAQALGSEIINLDDNVDVVNKRRALTPHQAESSPDHRKERQQERTSDIQPQHPEHSVVEATRPVTNEKEGAMSTMNPCTTGVRRIRLIASKGKTSYRGSTSMSRNSLVERAGNHDQGKERDKGQPKTTIYVEEDAVPQQPHCFSRFEPARPTALHTNVGDTKPGNRHSSQGNGGERLDLDAIQSSNAGTALRPPKIPKDYGQTRYLHLLTDPVNSYNQALMDPESRALAVQVLAAAGIPQNSGSFPGLARHHQQSGPTRAQTDHDNRTQLPRQGDSPAAELLRMSTDDLTNAESITSSLSASKSPRGPSALKPAYTGHQLQEDRPEGLQYLQGESLKWRRTFGIPRSHLINGMREEPDKSPRLTLENRSAGDQDRARSSSVKETQGPMLEPVCVNCRKKKRKCDRKRPRCGNCVKQNEDGCVPVGTI